ncbi:MAG: hypothetical protein QM516_08355 [Limnohabitans sp.]|nr:hypothetical protein [Limnohabitans sp.]
MQRSETRASSVDQHITNFPQDWAGTWQGTLTSTAYRVSGEKREDAPEISIEMTLEIAPTSDPQRWSWTITYDGDAGKQVRPYELVIRDVATGSAKSPAISRSRFAIDEKNGIVIPVHFADDVLWSSFEVLGTRVDVREELVRGDARADTRADARADTRAAALDEIRIEMISTKIDDPEVSGGTSAEGESDGGGVPAVRSWSPISIQRGVLRRR